MLGVHGNGLVGHFKRPLKAVLRWMAQWRGAAEASRSSYHYMHLLRYLIITPETRSLLTIHIITPGHTLSRREHFQHTTCLCKVAFQQHLV
jgi:hypothetical protein